MRLLFVALAHAAGMPAAWAQTVEVAFSPDAGANALVLRVLASARQSVRMAAFSFTSPTVLRGLLDARSRGVDVALVADAATHTSRYASGKSAAAFNALAHAGAAVRVSNQYALLHDKFMVVDGLHVQTGSFNYTTAAARANSENVMVVWNEPATARAYLRHWQSRFDQAAPWQAP